MRSVGGEGLRGFARWLFGLLVLAAVFALVLNASEIRVFASLLKRSEPLWLIAAILLQLSTYVWLSMGWRAVLSRTATALKLRQLLPLSVAKLFADQAAPTAGISGNVLLVESLAGKSVPRSDALATMALSIIGDYAAYIVIALATLVLLWSHHEATLLLASSVSLFLCIALAILASIFLLISRGGNLPRPLRQFKWAQNAAKALSEVPLELLKNRKLVFEVSCCFALIFLADAATLWAALAGVGFRAPFSTAFIAYTLASIAVTLGPIPMGLGSFEAVSIGMMRALGVPIEAAAAATLIFRGLSLWLPLVPGLVLARRLMPAKSKDATA